jgi:hypothetical protein
LFVICEGRTCKKYSSEAKLERLRAQEAAHCSAVASRSSSAKKRQSIPEDDTAAAEPKAVKEDKKTKKHKTK